MGDQATAVGLKFVSIVRERDVGENKDKHLVVFKDTQGRDITVWDKSSQDKGKAMVEAVLAGGVDSVEPLPGEVKSKQNGEFLNHTWQMPGTGRKGGGGGADPRILAAIEGYRIAYAALAPLYVPGEPKEGEPKPPPTLLHAMEEAPKWRERAVALAKLVAQDILKVKEGL
jgi:hypothetical protein